MDVIVSKKGEEEEEDNNDFILFPQLRSLKLGELQNLESFCISRSEAQQIFNYQVAFPKLEKLRLENCTTLRDIHLWQISAGGGERSLGELRVKNCDQVSVAHLMQCTKEIGKLVLKNCNGVRQVFDLEGPNVGEGQHVVSCPQVKVLVLKNLPQLTCLWNKDPHVILGPRNLKFLYIHRCSLVTNLFTPSVAMALEKLLALFVKSCETMEEIVAVTNKEGEEEVTGEIVFPKLMWLGLNNLPNLKSFCSNPKYTINLPSLGSVFLLECPKMQTFTSGQVSGRPQIHMHTRFDDDAKGVRISDLNKYIEQRFMEEPDFETIDCNDDTDSDTINEDTEEIDELVNSDDFDFFGKDSSDEDGDPIDED